MTHDPTATQKSQSDSEGGLQRWRQKKRPWALGAAALNLVSLSLAMGLAVALPFLKAGLSGAGAEAEDRERVSMAAAESVPTPSLGESVPMGTLPTTPAATRAEVYGAVQANLSEPAPDVGDGVGAGRPLSSVAVRVIDGLMDGPKTIAEGPVRFRITNEGSQVHSFAIQGPVDRDLGRPLQPGQTEWLDARLEPGAYVAYCPTGAHRVEERAPFTVVR